MAQTKVWLDVKLETYFEVQFSGSVAVFYNTTFHRNSSNPSRSTIYGSPPGHTDRGLAFPSQQPDLLAPDPRYPGFQFQSKFPIEKILPDFHPIPGYLDPRLICLAWPLGEPSPVSVRRFLFILPSFGVSQFTILFNTSITPNRLSAPSPAH